MADVVLVTMPWDILGSPSLALGTLHQVLLDAGIPVASRSLKLRWMEYLLRHQELEGADRIALADYAVVACAGGGLGDWVFAEPPIAPRAGIAEYRACLADRRSPDWLRKLDEMRRLAPGFLDECAATLLAARPRVVGFTTTFCQNLASLALARRLKDADPTIRIVFGGSNCEGPMGAELQRSFPWIDVVVRGEGEAVVPDLVRALRAGEPPPPAPGLCYFEDGRQVVIPNLDGMAVPMDAVPAPNYDDYFAELATCSFRDALRSSMFVSYESARGCWWGEISHCTFCGLNGANMAFRSKSADRVLEEIVELAQRYRVLDLHAVDNILDHRYFDELIPAITKLGLDLHLYYEVKSNLKKAQLEALRGAGVRKIQPGIESLSTPILRLMKKGVTAWQNLRLIKWCKELGIEPDWNIIYGFPGEPESAYHDMAELMPMLHHLRPPSVGPLGVHRFSPYQRDPGAYGIEIAGSAAYYRLLYDVAPPALVELAYDFDYRYRDGRSTDDYVPVCIEAIERWRAAHAAGASLVARRGPGFVHIRDARDPSAGTVTDLLLEGEEADVYLACDDGARLAAICRQTGCSTATVLGVLDKLLAEGLVFREGDHFLGLAVPARPRPAAAVADEADAPARRRLSLLPISASRSSTV